MAGQAQRGSRAHGRSPRAVSSRPPVAAASDRASGSAVVPIPTGSTVPATSTRTRLTFRTLVLRGLAPDEAANLTAFLCGIPVTHHWNLNEVNRLLFIRALARSGRFGARDGARH